AALDMVKRLQDHRGSASYFVLREPELGARQPGHEKAADQSFAALQAHLARLGDKGIADRIANIGKAWEAIKADVTGHRIDQRRVVEVHNAAISETFRLVRDLSAWYKLDLIPEPATHYLTRGTLQDLPVLSETIGQLRAPVVSRLKELAAVRAG